MAGVLELPRLPGGVVLLARERGARSSHLRDQLHRAGLATLLLPLHAPARERDAGAQSGIETLCSRLAAAADWLAAERDTMQLALGVHGGGEDGAAALRLAASHSEQVVALVLRGARPDLAGADVLARVRAPTLLIVGEQDGSAIEYNRGALQQLRCEKDLSVLRGPICANSSPRALDESAQLAARWFRGYFGGSAPAAGYPRA